MRRSVSVRGSRKRLIFTETATTEAIELPLTHGLGFGLKPAHGEHGAVAVEHQQQVVDKR